MKEEKKKLIKMTDEILKYFISKGGEKINLNIEQLEDKYVINANSKLNLSDYELEYIFSKLDKHKDREYDIFWELIGEVYDEDELELLFIISDEVKITYENNILSFYLELSNSIL